MWELTRKIMLWRGYRKGITSFKEGKPCFSYWKLPDGKEMIIYEAGFATNLINLFLSFLGK